MTTPIDQELERLLQSTVQQHLSPDARVANVTLTPLKPGMSGTSLHRCTVALRFLESAIRTRPVSTQVTLVIKNASLRERRVLALLNGQGQSNVPFSHTLDLTTDAPVLMCLQDVGDTYRPVSLAPITDEALREEATGLAAIHYRNLGQDKTLGWLPRVDSTYVKARVLDMWWRPAWERALRNAPLRRALNPHIPSVEQAAVRLAHDMEPLLSDPHTQTLVHTDIHPSNVLVQEGRPFYIDWSATHYGSLYIDLPHHFCTRAQAEHYRAALAAHGDVISTTDFDASYRVAARLIGFRYLWWTLAGWRGSGKDTAWVMHYVRLITGQV